MMHPEWSVHCALAHISPKINETMFFAVFVSLCHNEIPRFKEINIE